ncbi:MAG: antitoxin [Chloroflexi bacterium]|nr:antitoxin [Chloroflexota bacterium]
MYERRLQLLLDQERYDRVAARARGRKVSVATVIREAVDQAVPVEHDRSSAADVFLSGTQLQLPDPELLRAELDAAHDRT